MNDAAVKPAVRRWDERYAATEGYLFGTAPNGFLVAQATERLRPGQQVLAVADGEGRNGVWLAEQGLDVTTVEASAVAVARARDLAQARGVSPRIECADLTAWDWGSERFDAIAAIFIQFAGPKLRPRLFASMREALKPGGVLLLEGYGMKQLDYRTGGPSEPDHLYTEAMLRELFADWRILHLAEYDAEVDEGQGHRGLSALVDLVAQRP